jgi:hypothetical protein
MTIWAPMPQSGVLVGRGGLEPPTSALDRPERCANDVPQSRISRASCAELCGAALPGWQQLFRALDLLVRCERQAVVV